MKQDAANDKIRMSNVEAVLSTPARSGALPES
jgi:hypothetical protein